MSRFPLATSRSVATIPIAKPATTPATSCAGPLAMCRWLIVPGILMDQQINGRARKSSGPGIGYSYVQLGTPPNFALSPVHLAHWPAQTSLVDVMPRCPAVHDACMRLRAMCSSAASLPSAPFVGFPASSQQTVMTARMSSSDWITPAASKSL